MKRYVNATLRYNTRIYECLADGCRERAGKYVYFMCMNGWME